MRNRLLKRRVSFFLATVMFASIVIRMPITLSAEPIVSQSHTIEGQSVMCQSEGEEKQVIDTTKSDDGIDVPESSFVDITDWEKSYFAEENADNIKKADISGKLISYNPRTVLVTNDGEECTLARYPNKYDDGTDCFIANGAYVLDNNHICMDHTLAIRRICTYHTLDGLLLFGYLTTVWYKDLIEIGTYDPGTLVFSIPYPEQTIVGGLEVGYHEDIALVNISEELDAVGEYWIDKTGNTLYVFSPSGDYHIARKTLSSVSVPYLGTYGLFKYYVDDNNVTIYDYTGEETSIVIPSQIEGYPVTGIGNKTFKDCNSVVNIIIPDSVTDIGEQAFKGCASLIDVTIPDSVTRIGMAAFCNCTSLKDIIIPDSVTTIGDWAFEGCSMLESVSLSNSLKAIGPGTFYGCAALKDIIIPDSVMIIEGYPWKGAFSNCTALESVTIGNSVALIGECSFAGCSSLVQVTIPNGVITIEQNAFLRCSLLTNVIIPDSVTSIGPSAFSDCSSLANLALSDGLTSIEKSVFYNCSSLTSVTIPDGVTSIESSSFSGCGSLTSVVIPDSVTTIESNAFSGCSSMAEVYLGSGLNAIRDGAFKDCTSLQKVYYNGTENDWLRKVYVGDNNEYLRNAEFIFNYDGPTLTHVPAKAPTFEEEGNIEYWIDLNTGLCYSDDEGKNQIDKDSVIIPKLVDTTVVFEDVKANKWYTESVNFAYNSGLMNGMTETTFEPNSPMSRAMLVTVLWRAEGSPEPASATPFTDLKAKWYKNAVAWAYENGIVNGMTATTFGPDVSISREQIATIIYRYAEFRGDDVSARASITSFPDASKVSKWAKDALSWAVAEGIISGTKAGDKTILDPKGNATRAQVATILMRYLEK